MSRNKGSMRTRRTTKRTPKSLIRVLCEGRLTEPSYFKSIFDRNPANRKRFDFKAYKPQDHSPMGVVKAAKEEYREARQNGILAKEIIVWAVFDCDGHANIQRALSLAAKEGISVAVSNICFEFWILLHYMRTSKPFEKCDDVIQEVKKFEPSYKKNALPDDLIIRIPQAIKNGKWLVQQNIPPQNSTLPTNPSTTAYQLAEFLWEL